MDIDGIVAEHSSRITSEKVRLATHNLRERGMVTHKAPVGYLNQGNMDHKPFDPIRAPIIKKLFEMYATGDWALSDLSVWANQQGLTSMPSRRKRTEEEMLAEDGEEIKIEAIARSTTLGHLHKILTNPFYTGEMGSVPIFNFVTLRGTASTLSVRNNFFAVAQKFSLPGLATHAGAWVPHSVFRFRTKLHNMQFL